MTIASMILNIIQGGYLIFLRTKPRLQRIKSQNKNKIILY
jgi:hypothetical protein